MSSPTPSELIFSVDERRLDPPQPLGLSFTNTIDRHTETINTITGGHPVPPDKDWSATIFIAGVGLIEWRCINGTVTLRGDLKQSITAGGSFTTVRQMPKGSDPYWPDVEKHFPIFAVDTGATYRIGLVRITPAGVILLSAPTGKFDTATFTGISYPVF